MTLGLMLVALVCLGGCGGPMTPGELSSSVDTLSSSAAAGQLLSKDVAQGRSKDTFARAYSRELGEVVDHEAEKLSDATPSPAVRDSLPRALELAQKISTALGEVQTSPGDTSTARQAEAELAALSKRAQDLSQSL
jgi:outer membrane murein-binding lipoprotein Lpp